MDPIIRIRTKNLLDLEHFESVANVLVPTLANEPCSTDVKTAERGWLAQVYVD